ncbi:MAG TPA: hypothetical protein VK675_02730, partial [Candidatus Paceibacterota bacterium]|nr:hypothetical protein [Candidatus Paceibacterota bacterium]
MRILSMILKIIFFQKFIFTKKLGFLLLALFVAFFFIGNVKRAEAVTSIIDCTGLQNMSLNLAEDYTLANNIDCSATSGWNAGKGFIPIGNNNAGALVGYFTGSLHGNGFTIQNLHIVRPTENFIGLIGQTNGADFQNLTITGSIEGRSNTGTLVGAMNGSDTISNVSSSVTIVGHTQNIGGLVGDAGNINATGSSYSGSITVNEPGFSVGNTGGLFGQCSGDINSSTATATITVTGSSIFGIGGLVGISDGTDTGNNASGTITVTSAGSSVDTVGGLYGDFSGTANFVTSSVDITVTADSVSNIGGFIGNPESSTIIGGAASGGITIHGGSVDHI